MYGLIFSIQNKTNIFAWMGHVKKVWCMSVKKVPYITPWPWPLLHMAWNRLDRLLFLKKSMDNNPKQHESSYWELSFSCYCNSTTLPSSTSMCWQYSADTVPVENYSNLSNWFHAMQSGGHLKGQLATTVDYKMAKNLTSWLVMSAVTCSHQQQRPWGSHIFSVT